MNEDERRKMYAFFSKLEELIRITPDRNRLIEAINKIKREGKPGTDRVIEDYFQIMSTSHHYSDEEWEAMNQSARKSLGNFCKCGTHGNTAPPPSKQNKAESEFDKFMTTLSDTVHKRLKKQKGKDDLII